MAPHSSRPAYDNALPASLAHTLPFLHYYALYHTQTRSHFDSFTLLFWSAQQVSLSLYSSLSAVRVYLLYRFFALLLPLLLLFFLLWSTILFLIFLNWFFFVLLFSSFLHLFLATTHGQQFPSLFSFNDVTWPYSLLMSTTAFAANRLTRRFAKYVWSAFLLLFWVFRFVVNSKLIRRYSINIYTRMNFFYLLINFIVVHAIANKNKPKTLKKKLTKFFFRKNKKKMWKSGHRSLLLLKKALSRSLSRSLTTRLRCRSLSHWISNWSAVAARPN